MNSRRKFVKNMLLLAGMNLLTRTLPANAENSTLILTDWSGFTNNLCSLLPNHNVDSACEIGKAYINQQRIRTFSALENKIAYLLNDSFKRPAEKATNHVSDAITSDFATNRVININGWVLANSEVAICALIAAHQADCNLSR